MKRIFTVLFALAAVAFAYAGDLTPNGMWQGDLYTFLSNVVTIVNEIKDNSDLVTARSQAQTTSYPNVHQHAAGSATVDIGTTFTYNIGGYLYSKTASDSCGELFATAQATGTSQAYLFSVNSAGTATCTTGTAVTYGSASATYPAVPANHAPFGGMIVELPATVAAAYTFGTTAFNYSATASIVVYSIGVPPTGTSAPTAISASDLSLTGL